MADKHIPKDKKNKFSISEDATKTLLGLMIMIISLIGLLSSGIVGEFLSYISVYLFGLFYFFIFIVGIVYGTYLMVKKKTLKFRINLNFLGFVLLIVGIIIASSNRAQEKLVIGNFIDLFNAQLRLVSSSPLHLDSLNNVGLMGGGFLGYFLAAVLNSSISRLGASILTYTFITLGLILMLKDIVVVFIAFIKKNNLKRKEKKAALLLNAQTEPENLIPLGSEKITPVRAAQKTEIKNLSAHEEMEYNPFKKVREKAPTPLITPEPSINESIKPTYNNSSNFVGNSDVYLRSEGEIDNSLKPGELYEIKEKEVEETITPKRNGFFSFLHHSNDSSDETEKKEVTVESKKIEPLKNQMTQKAPEPPKVLDAHYILPPISLLSPHEDTDKTEINIRTAEERAYKINQLFQDFRIKAQVVSYTIGPSVTRFDIKTEPGVRISVLNSIQNEIAVCLGGNKTVRIEMIVQGKDTSGIEVGNAAPTMVAFKEVYGTLISNQKDKLLIPLGKDISGDVINISIDQLPHLLVAGATGSGKSVFVHSLIMSLIMRNYPDELKLILVDPKKVEFTKYHDMPHLYCRVITEANHAKIALVRLVDEMERRYSILAKFEVSNIKEYRAASAEDPNAEKIPNIVIIIDEYADLLSSNDAKETEKLVQRIAQKSRAAGIYMIIATQRPSVNVITGDIKANIPARIALSLPSNNDSRTIIDEPGAENLVGRGDMLARIPIFKSLIRVQSAYVDNNEISRVVKYLKEHSLPSYNPAFDNLNDSSNDETTENIDEVLGASKRRDKDEMYDEVKAYVMASGTCSTSLIQRRFGLGYGRAASIIDYLEDENIVAPGPNNRKIVMVRDDNN